MRPAHGTDEIAIARRTGHVSIPKAALAIGVAPNTLRNWARAGKLRAVYDGGVAFVEWAQVLKTWPLRAKVRNVPRSAVDVVDR